MSNGGCEKELHLKLGAAFLAIYVIWGSTYLAIRLAVETIPPFFMASTRFITGGLILYALTRSRDAQAPTPLRWRDAFVVGGLMLFGGNGAAVWAAQWVPSGLMSLLVATVPLWMVLLNSLHHRMKPSAGAFFGMLLGFAGVALLVGSIENISDSNMILPCASIMCGAFLWASGSLYSRSVKTSSSQLLPPAMQMIAGGILLLFASLITGEYSRFVPNQVSLNSMLSLLYLIIFSPLAFASYIWLLNQTDPYWVSTYAYVNPIIALILGSALAGEALTMRSILAAIIIIVSVIVITIYPNERNNI